MDELLIYLMLHQLKSQESQQMLKQHQKGILRLRDKIPNNVTIGISGDALAATGLNAGCEIWYSVIGGIFPNVALALTKAARTGDAALAIQLSDNLTALWNSFKNNGGSLRVVATIAEEMGLVSAPSLPLPLYSIQGDERERIMSLIRTLSLS
ncbi:dihydrodipicolinate synthase family protein [Aeromonas hydrophila]|uniref:dihydrodipicolinate synthase family protein n=1 Tax=Aeromonas hydrophila TaxID=644 RepID=UPI00209677BE|nr:dihydrodipicolinate synthase family protein [Aeromonas hydrophila]